jgi:hypothetical protein
VTVEDIAAFEPFELAESQFLQGFQRIPVVRRSALRDQ